MDWATAITTIKSAGYTGGDEDLAAVKSWLDENGHNAETIEDADGNKHAIADLHKAATTKPLNAGPAQVEADLRKQIADLKAANDEAASLGHKVEKREGAYGADVAARESITVGKDRIEDDGKWGFKNFGEYALSVKKAANPVATQASWDERLTKAPTTYASEGVGADGGFAVPPDFLTEIMSHAFEATSLLPLCRRITTGRNQIVFSVNESAPWDTAGIQTRWEGEAQQGTQYKPALEQRTIRLHKLMSLAPVTEELMEDAPAMSDIISQEAGAAIGFKIDDSIINGTGVGQPLGILNSSALISLTRTASGNNIDTADIPGMYERMMSSSLGKFVWLNHRSNLSDLQLMLIGDTPVYLRPAGLADAPHGMIEGRPVVYHEACQANGTSGDIIAADLSKYVIAEKVGGMKASSSVHLWFDYDMMALKFTQRIGGEPWMRTPVSPKNGSATYSPFVTLADA